MNRQTLNSMAKILALFLLSVGTTSHSVSRLKLAPSPVGKAKRIKPLPKARMLSSKVKQTTQEMNYNKVTESGGYIDGLFLKKENQEYHNIYKKILYSSYDGKVAEHKRIMGLFDSWKALPLPEFELTFEGAYGGATTKPGFLQAKQDKGNLLESNKISIKSSIELAGLVLGPAQCFLGQAVANADAEVAHYDNYLQICKAVQSYLSSLRKLRIFAAQMQDFTLEDQEGQARYKVGSCNDIEALQARQRLDVAVARYEDAYNEMEVSKKNLKQITRNLTDEDFQQLDRLSRMNVHYGPITDQVLKAPLNTPLTRYARLKMRSARTNELFHMSKSVLPTVGVEAEPFESQGSRRDQEPNIKLSATWSVGLRSASAIIHGILDSHRVVEDSAKQIRRAEEELAVVANRYNRTLRILQLGLRKVDTCRRRLQHHAAMDQADPGAHFDKRGKYKEDLYLMQKELEDTLDKVAISYLEYLALAGLLFDPKVSISNQVRQYNNKQKVWRPKRPLAQKVTQAKPNTAESTRSSQSKSKDNPLTPKIQLKPGITVKPGTTISPTKKIHLKR